MQSVNTHHTDHLSTLPLPHNCAPAMASVIINNPDIDISSDDDDEDSKVDFVPYSQRPDWSDVQPIEQNDGPHSVVSIRYTEQFSDTFNYFRAILASNEISERAFQLITDCIKLNPSNYTVWHYRRLLLEKLHKNLQDELIYIEAIIGKNQKNYQVWEHYKYVLSRTKTLLDQKQVTDFTLDELTLKVKIFIHSILREDSKNYHAWQQLQWLIQDWSQWDGELEYVEKLIDDDIRNNSAWNHRFYVIQHTTGFTDTVIQSEVEYTVKLIQMAPNNESAWNYLLGVLRKSSQDIDSFPVILQACEKLLSDNNETRSSFLLSFMVTYLSEQLSKMHQSALDVTKQEQFKQLFTKANDYCNELATKVDTLRNEYWKYQAKLLSDKFQCFV